MRGLRGFREVPVRYSTSSRGEGIGPIPLLHKEGRTGKYRRTPKPRAASMYAAESASMEERKSFNPTIIA